MASMVSAPATIPATRAATFTSALAPADPGTRTCVAARSCSPARSANLITGISPAHDTRFGSSKLAEMVWQTHIYRVSFCFGSLASLRRTIVPGQKDIRASRPAQNATFTGGSRLSPADRASIRWMVEAAYSRRSTQLARPETRVRVVSRGVRNIWGVPALSIVSLALLASACTACDGPVHPILTVTVCEAGFQQLTTAQNGDPNINLLDAQAESLHACKTPKEWLDMAAKYPKALGGQSPEDALSAFCKGAENLSAAPACAGHTEQSTT